MERPITPIDEFERALDKAALTKEEYELIDYIRYTSVFTQPSLIKDLKKTRLCKHTCIADVVYQFIFFFS